MLFDTFPVTTRPVWCAMALQAFADSQSLTLHLDRLPSGRMRGTFTRGKEKSLEVDIIPVAEERFEYLVCLPHPVGQNACIAFFEWASETYTTDLSRSMRQAKQAEIDFARAEQYAKRRQIVIPSTVKKRRRTHRNRQTPVARQLCERQLEMRLKRKLNRREVMKRVWRNLPPLDDSAYEPWELIPDHAWDRKVVQLLWDGRTDPEIARAIGTKPKTITNRLSQLRKIFPKSVPTRNQLKRRAKI